MRAPEFWRRDGPWPRLLAPAAMLYALGGRLRAAMTTPWRAPVPVICVGNLVAGGAGKTPVAIAIARRLAARGMAVHCVSRGYGGRLRGPVRVDPAAHTAREVGDEPLLLAAHAATWVARDRAAGARAAYGAGAQAIVLDDGFQNPSLAKDLSLIVVDGGYGFGNGRVMPAGPLREPLLAGLGRADAVVLMGEDKGGLRPHLERRLPVVAARLAPGDESLRGQRVVAFAGIGRPAKFFATLEAMGCRVVARFAVADHHRYTPDEIMQIVERAQAERAIPVTTEKDFVRLPEDARIMVRALPVRLEWADDAALDDLLKRVLEARD